MDNKRIQSSRHDIPVPSSSLVEKDTVTTHTGVGLILRGHRRLRKDHKIGIAVGCSISWSAYIKNSGYRCCEVFAEKWLCLFGPCVVKRIDLAVVLACDVLLI